MKIRPTWRYLNYQCPILDISKKNKMLHVNKHKFCYLRVGQMSTLILVNAETKVQFRDCDGNIDNHVQENT